MQTERTINVNPPIETSQDVIKDIVEKRQTPPKYKSEVGSFQKKLQERAPELDYFRFDVATRDVADINRSGEIVARYDNYTGQGDEDRLSQGQSWYGKLGRGVVKSVAKAGIYATQASVGAVYGAYKAIEDGDLMSFIDNDLTSILDDAEATLDRNLVNYYSDEEKSMGALRKVLTTNFWADDFLGGMAFLTGAILPTIAISALTGGTIGSASLAASFGKAGGKRAMTAAAKKGIKTYADDAFKVATNKSSTGMFVEGAPRVAAAEGFQRLSGSVLNKEGAEILRNGFRRGALLGEKIGQGLDVGKFVGTSAMFEASLEARGTMKEATQNYLSMYAEQHDGAQPSYEELSEYLKTLDTSAKGVFWGNVGLLTLTGGAVYGKFLGLPELFGASAKRFGNKMIGLSVVESEAVKGGVDMAKANWLQKTIGTSYGVLKKPLALGAVEMPLQRTLNQAGQLYTNSKYDIENQDSVSVMEALKFGMVDAYTSDEGASEMINGFLLGLLGGIPIEGIGTAARSRGGVQRAKKAGLKTEGLDWSGLMPQGFGAKSYKAQRAKLDAHVETYNKEVELFRNLNRSNSMMNFKEGMFDSAIETTATYSFIKAHEALNQYTDILGNYDFAVDNMNLTEAQLTDMGVDSESDLVKYKTNLKEQFRNDYKIYKESKRVTDAIGLKALQVESGLTDGNIMELSDAIAFQTMLAGKNGAKSEAIGKEIEARVGEHGLNDAMKFLNVIATSNDTKLKEQVNEYIKQEKVVKSLEKEVRELVTKSNIEGRQEGVNETVRKQQVLSQRLGDMLARQEELSKQINEKLYPLRDKFGELNETNSVSIDKIINKNNMLGDYILALKANGRTREAQTLANMANEYQVANLASNELSNTTQRMFEDNFFSSADGKTFMEDILGKRYKASNGFKETLRTHENDVLRKMHEMGVPVQDYMQVVTQIEANEQLSDREKYRAETLLRAAYMSSNLGEIAKGIAEVTADSIQGEVVGEVTPSTDQVDVKADTVNFSDTARTDIEAGTPVDALNAYINEVKRQLNTLTLPNSEQLRKNELNKEKVARLTALLAQLENGVLDKSALASEGITLREEVVEMTTQELALQQLQEQKKLEQESEFTSEEIVAEIQKQIEAVEKLIKDKTDQEVKDAIANVLESLEDGLSESDLNSLVSNLIFEGTEVQATLGGKGDFIKYEYKGETYEGLNQLKDKINKEIKDGERSVENVRQLLDSESNRANQRPQSGDATQNASETENAIRQKRELDEATQKTREEIERLQQEIEAVESPINFTDNEAYQEYYDLLDKEELTSEEQTRFEELEDRINNWFAIMGARAEGVDLTDVIKQLNNFSKIEIAEGTGTVEATPKQIQEDVNRVDKTASQNYTYGLNFTGVFSKAVSKGDITYHELSGFTEEGFKATIEKYNQSVDPTQEISLDGRYTLQTDKNTIIIPQELADEINEKGVLRIGMPLQASGTYYSLVLQPVSNSESGVMFEPIVSDYETNISDADLNNVEAGGEVSLSVDFSLAYNKQILDEALAEIDRVRRPTKEKFEKLVDDKANELQAESKTLAKINERVNDLQSKDKLTERQEGYLAKALDQLETTVNSIRSKAESAVRKQLGETSGKSLSEATKQKIRDNINISAVNKDGEAVNTLKATRPNTGNQSKDADYNKHIGLRQEVIKDIEALVDMYAVNETGQYVNSEIRLPVKSYLPGAPNYLVSQTPDGKLQSAPKEITVDDLKKIDDNGFISGGKVTTKKGLENVNTMFVKTQLEATKGDDKVKVPIVIIKKGKHNIAYPVEVSRIQELPYTREDFDAVYDSNISMTDKAITLNNMLAEMGVNVMDRSNSFITMGDVTTLTESNYNNILDGMEAKEYISSVEGWTSKETTMEQDLTGNARIDLNLSNPFISPKLQFDYAGVKEAESTVDNAQGKKDSKKSANYVGDEISQKITDNIFKCKK